jgi:peroxiredoxin
MKKIFLLLVLGGLFACSVQEPEGIKISGVIENPGEQTYVLMALKSQIDNSVERFDLELDENNAFSIAFDLSDVTIGQIVSGRTRLPLFLEPGYDLTLTADGSKLAESLVFAGKGSVENNFLLAYNRDELSKTDGRMFHALVKDVAPEDIASFLDELFAKREAHYEQAKSELAFSKSFDLFTRGQLKYEKLNILMEYPMVYQNQNRLAERVVLPEGYYDFLDASDLFDDSYLISDQYGRFVDGYMNYYYQNKYDAAASDLSRNQALFQIAGEVLPRQTAFFQQGKIVNSALNRSAFTEAEALYLTYKELNPDQKFAEVVDATYEVVASLSPGQPAPDFTLTDINGNEVSLSDFKGSVVYLDFWASWCGPCIQQVPHAKEMKKRMAAYYDSGDLVSLYVSVDTDGQAWKDGIAKHGIEGVHVWAEGWDSASRLYNVSGVPTYYIIGRDGKIFDNRPPRPSAANIDEVLLTALGQ